MDRVRKMPSAQPLRFALVMKVLRYDSRASSRLATAKIGGYACWYNDQVSVRA